MKNKSIEVVEQLFNNPHKFLTIDKPQKYDNMVVVPLIFEGTLIDFITMSEAEEQNLVNIEETNSVEKLSVVNKSDRKVLIPFGATVSGGKQDRTIWEPILLPVGAKQYVSNVPNAQTIYENVPPIPGISPNTSIPTIPTVANNFVVPAKCIEQARWSYKKSKGFRTTKTRIHPNIAFAALSPLGQGDVWGEIQAHRSEMNFSGNVAPTQSYLEMSRITKKDTSRFVNKFKNIEDQCGVAVFINGEFIGMEFYANPSAWSAMSKDVLNAFSVEAIRSKDKPLEKVVDDYYSEFFKILQNLMVNFSVRKGIGLGDVVEFKSDGEKWRGNTLIYENSLAQFYLVSKRGGNKNKSPINFPTLRNINQRPRNINQRSPRQRSYEF